MEKRYFLREENNFSLEDIKGIPLWYVQGTAPAWRKDDGKFDEFS